MSDVPDIPSPRPWPDDGDEPDEHYYIIDLWWMHWWMLGSI